MFEMMRSILIFEFVKAFDLILFIDCFIPGKNLIDFLGHLNFNDLFFHYRFHIILS